MAPAPKSGPPSIISLVGSPSVWESITRTGLGSRRPLGVPGLEQEELALGKALLAGAQFVARVEVQAIVPTAFQQHQIFVVEDEVCAFVEGREHGQRLVELPRLAPRKGVAGRRFLR